MDNSKISSHKMKINTNDKIHNLFETKNIKLCEFYLDIKKGAIKSKFHTNF